MRFRFAAALLAASWFIAPAHAQPAPTAPQAITAMVPNASSIGTTLNKLAKLTSSGAVITATTDTAAFGVVVGGAGTTGNAQITIAGTAACIFDGATTEGDWVINSTTSGGECHDSGSATPGAGSLGIVQSTNGAGGTYLVTWHLAPSSVAIPVPLGSGGTGQTTAAAARGSSGLDIDSCTSTGDANYSIAAANRCVYHTALSAARTDTLPAANSVNPGQILVVTDFAGVATSSHTITLQRSGSDTINGVSSVVAINAQYGAGIFWSDGSSRWTFFPATTTGGSGTVTQVVCGTGLSGGTITTTGTCAVDLSLITAALGSNVSLSNTSNFFDGPSIAQGSTGTWWVSGSVIVTDTAGAAAFICKLWDGTTVIAAAQGSITITGVRYTLSLSGYLASPAGNLRISCQDETSTSGSIRFNDTGTSKDSTISAMRIQ